MLYPGDIVDRTYQVCNEIGAGGMGVVYLAIHLRLNKYVVMKKIKNTSFDLSSLRNEVDVLKSLHHTYLPQVYDFIEYDGDLYTIIDYIDGYDLKYYIEHQIAVTESQLIKWLTQLCEVLSYLHSHNPRVLHLDIKPANIIIQTNGDVCLIDFGISMLGNDRLRGLSYEYSSPEQNYNAACIDQGAYDALYDLDERTDIYSLGATFYQIITGLTPSCCYALAPVLPNAAMQVSESLAAIIDKAVAYDREERYTDASQMLKALNNIFKLSKKYKHFIAIQITASVMFCLMIFFGAFLIYNGVNTGKKSAFEADYNSYLAALDQHDTVQAGSLAKKLVNTPGYKSLMDDKTAAEIYHSMGDIYFEGGDYVNAADCYHRASGYKTDIREICYRDNALSLLEDQRVDEAKAVLAELNKEYPSSSSGSLISAHLAYKEGNTQEAKALVEKALQQKNDSDTVYTAQMLLGDIAARDRALEDAVNAYRNASGAKETSLVLRKLGSALMKLAAVKNSGPDYKEALKVYKIIYDVYLPTEDDVFNLAQCYLLSDPSNGAKECMTVLEDYTADNPDSCRSYILLALAADSVQDGRATEYCRKAHSLYKQLDADSAEKVDKESLTQIKALYKRCLKEEW